MCAKVEWFIPFVRSENTVFIFKKYGNIGTVGQRV